MALTPVSGASLVNRRIPTGRELTIGGEKLVLVHSISYPSRVTWDGGKPLQFIGRKRAKYPIKTTLSRGKIPKPSFLSFDVDA